MADDFVITVVNVANGATLTIDNADGDLTIGTLNIAEDGSVVVSKPIPDAVAPPTISGDTALTSTEGYGATTTDTYTITGAPTATVVMTTGHTAIK